MIVCERAGIVMKENDLGDKTPVGYSEPTFIAIRSGKHCSSTALSHGRGIEELVKKKNSTSSLRLQQGK